MHQLFFFWIDFRWYWVQWCWHRAHRIAWLGDDRRGGRDLVRRRAARPRARPRRPAARRAAWTWPSQRLRGKWAELPSPCRFNPSRTTSLQVQPIRNFPDQFSTNGWDPQVGVRDVCVCTGQRKTRHTASNKSFPRASFNHHCLSAFPSAHVFPSSYLIYFRHGGDAEAWNCRRQVGAALMNGAPGHDESVKSSSHYIYFLFFLCEENVYVCVCEQISIFSGVYFCSLRSLVLFILNYCRQFSLFLMFCAVPEELWFWTFSNFRELVNEHNS